MGQCRTTEAYPPFLGPLLKAGRCRLDECGVESPGLAAEFLLAHALQREPADVRRAVLVCPQEPVAEDAMGRFCEFLNRHEAGEPVAYILGEWEFYGLNFFVSPATLIPRPESELLVDAALAVADHALRSGQGPVRMADLGTGSGCLAVTVLSVLQQRYGSGAAHCIAVDISAGALAVAARNAQRHQVAACLDMHQADFTRSAFLHPLAASGGLDLILANPPYISAAEYAELAPGVREFEPCGALVPGAERPAQAAGQNGLEDIAALAGTCAEALRPGGFLLMEIGAEQGPDTLRLFQEQGDWRDTAIEKDLAGHDRLLRAVRT